MEMWQELKTKWFNFGPRSPWLYAAICVPFAIWIGVSACVARYAYGETVPQALYKWGIRWREHGPSPLELFFAVVRQATLFWFTFASNSPRVTDADKCTVRWMLIGAGLAWLMIGHRFILERS